MEASTQSNDPESLYQRLGGEGTSAVIFGIDLAPRTVSKSSVYLLLEAEMNEGMLRSLKMVGVSSPVVNFFCFVPGRFGQ